MIAPGGGETWRDGLLLLEERVAAAPEVLRRALATLPAELAVSARGASAGVETVVATGVGSSAAHARFFAGVLQELGLPARFLPLSAFAGAAPVPAAAGASALVVFSQGFSPNARLPLVRAEAWRSVWIVTSTPAPAPASASAGDTERPRDGAPVDGDAGERRAALAAAESAGVRVLRYPGGEEYGTLLRVVGPLVGHAAALALARALASDAGRTAREPAWAATSAEHVCARVAAAGARAAEDLADLGATSLEANLAFLAGGPHVERVGNLPLKVLEGMLCPQPPVWDLLEFAHGPFQQLHASRATLLALTRGDAPGEGDLLDRLRSMLVPDRHRLVRLHADLPGPLAVFEHEALLNAIVLRYVAERRVDQIAWPGRDADEPLYRVGESAAPITGPAPRHRPAAPVTAPDALLESLTWPEVEAAIAAGWRTAILPLGSTEQHGPHLPLATDTRIAAAVADRLARRVGDALALPALPLGCAEEHLGFAGTLSLRAPTLAAILGDVAASVAHHGFARLFVLTAHGGNREALEAALPALRARVRDLAIACPPSLPPPDVQHVASARFGVGAPASGHHAGEFETSLLARLDPPTVRWQRLAPGLVDVAMDPASIFTSRLREVAPDGTVGDPRGADPERAEAYLEAWVDWLVAIYRRDASWK